MEPHPPLGKLFIALGEKIIAPNRNINTSAFLATDYIKNISQGYSFAGVRFFPVLFATLSAGIFFLILYALSRMAIFSFLFTSLYLFENAIIVHSRGAMLESTQIFFALLLIWWTIYCVNAVSHARKSKLGWFGVVGVLYGLVMSVKLNGAMLGFTLIILLVAEFHYLGQHKTFIRNLFIKSFIFILSSLFIFISVYLIHFALARKAVDNRYYEASKQYKAIIDKRQTSKITNIPLMLKEHINFIFHYEKGVPEYDFCKEGENGSLPITWPFGDKGINYRWESNVGKVKYLYLQGNPIIWGMGILGVFLSVNLLVSYMFFNTRIKNKRLFFFIVVFLMLYVLYMGMAMSIARVMYLYHYFIPLILSFILSYLMFLYFFEERLKKNDKRIYIMVFILVLAIIITYVFFSPLTYYQPLTSAQFNLRNWFPFWGLKSVK